MIIKRRSFLGGASALIGSSLAGGALAQGRPAVTREAWDAQLLEALNAERFTCTLAPQADEGPFYAPESPLRRAITEGHKGESLRLGIQLGGLRGKTECTPLAGAVVDIWHSNAEGLYSNVGENIQNVSTAGETFMRGHQITDEHGYAEFDTIVPGWEAVAAIAPINYAARTPHIHVKIFHEWQVFDTQLYFPQELTDHLYAEVEPYKGNEVITVPGSDHQLKRLRNSDDGLFNLTPNKPLEVNRVDGRLFAKATIGTIGTSNRGVPSFYRGTM